MSTTGTRRAPIRRRLTQFIAALAIVTGMSVATAGTASAANVGEWACDYNSYHNSCLYITNLGGNMYSVHVGIDIYMSQQDAQNIINSGFRPTAALYGDDGSLNYRTTIPLTGNPTAWSGGYSAEFDKVVSGSLLNEDDDGVDEIIAKVSQYFPAAQRTFAYKTGEVKSSF